jgi:hypothetical protein
MTPDAHASRAEFLLEIADFAYDLIAVADRQVTEGEARHIGALTSLAQVHATLALRNRGTAGETVDSNDPTSEQQKRRQAEAVLGPRPGRISTGVVVDRPGDDAG